MRALAVTIFVVLWILAPTTAWSGIIVTEGDDPGAEGGQGLNEANPCEHPPDAEGSEIDPDDPNNTDGGGASAEGTTECWEQEETFNEEDYFCYEIAEGLQVCEPIDAEGSTGAATDEPAAEGSSSSSSGDSIGGSFGGAPDPTDDDVLIEDCSGAGGTQTGLAVLLALAAMALAARRRQLS